MTLDEARGLKHGQVIYSTIDKNADGTPTRWRVNGMVKTWKRDLTRIRIPVKHGLYDYGAIDETHLPYFSLTEELIG